MSTPEDSFSPTGPSRTETAHAQQKSSIFFISAGAKEVVILRRCFVMAATGKVLLAWTIRWLLVVAVLQIMRHAVVVAPTLGPVVAPVAASDKTGHPTAGLVVDPVAAGDKTGHPTAGPVVDPAGAVAVHNDGGGPFATAASGAANRLTGPSVWLAAAGSTTGGASRLHRASKDRSKVAKVAREPYGESSSRGP
eukprot:GHVS01041650.1.p1 GENE.GHVS01041650.1~~GHVS01041650.1.p1  ORF type:complete len:194 (+),score=30.63 GHVS01041650.1:323-904(+)